MKIDPRPFAVRTNERVRLDRRPTHVRPFYKSKDDYSDTLERHVCQLSDLQQLLYASNSHALLIIFQGMDAAGKDGVIRHVMSGVNPQGVQVHSFKHPSEAELEHDFMWREIAYLPERGNVAIFNRSYYEEVLIVRVHPKILQSESLGESKDKKHVWKGRFRSIVEFEQHLHRNGTRVIKFLLHLSKSEQRKRLLERIDDHDKNWKFNSGDLVEREFWRDYMRAYEDCLGATSRPHAPWYIVPADDKKNARLIVSQAIIDLLSSMKLRYPTVDEARRRELRNIRRQLVSREASE